MYILSIFILYKEPQLWKLPNFGHRLSQKKHPQTGKSFVLYWSTEKGFAKNGSILIIPHLALFTQKIKGWFTHDPKLAGPLLAGQPFKCQKTIQLPSRVSSWDWAIPFPLNNNEPKIITVDQKKPPQCLTQSVIVCQCLYKYQPRSDSIALIHNSMIN